MKDTDKILEFENLGKKALLPANQESQDFMLNAGPLVALKDATKRDIKLHNCYHKMIHFVYLQLPPHFQSKVHADDFYIFLKHIQGKYKVKFQFKDGTQMIEYESISFARMTEARFREYIKEQMVVLFEEIVLPLCKEPVKVWQTIEEEFEQFLNIIE